MSEYGDYTPSTWSSRKVDSSFTDARKRYDTHVGRGYRDAQDQHILYSAFIVPQLHSDALAHLFINIDGTGSMEEWPAVMFGKLPYFWHEVQEYMGQDLDICFSITGDANCDNYPLQVRDFARDENLEKRMQELKIEKGGGGQSTESYELTALYFARNVTLLNSVNPIFIFIGDEQPYPFVDPEQAKKYAGIELTRRLSTKKVFDELKRKYSVYFIQKPYGDTRQNTMDAKNREIYKSWVELVGADHIAPLADPQRVVDVIFGILGKETNRVSYYRAEMQHRQTAEQRAVAFKSLESIQAEIMNDSHADISENIRLLESPSRMHEMGKSARSKKLL